MDRPIAHKWLPFYFWILFGGVGPTIYAALRALNMPDSGGYIFLATMLIALRVAACWGMFTRKLWGWHLNFGALFAIPVLKMITVLSFSGNYSGNAAGPGSVAIVISWLIYAVPNAIYFQKRKYLFDDGKGPNKMLFSGFRVLDSLTSSESSASNTQPPNAAVDVPLTEKRASAIGKVPEAAAVKFEEGVLIDKEMEEEMASIDLSNKSDEEFYELAAKEFYSGEISKGLMLKAEVASGGDKDKTRLFCIRTRAQELAQEAGALGRIKEAYTDAVKDSKSADEFLKRIETFRADYPDNAEINALQAEFEYKHLGKRVEMLRSEYDYACQRLEVTLKLYGSFLADHPGHLMRQKVEEKKSECERELAKHHDRMAFSKMQQDAQELIRRHEYKDALFLYQKYLAQYSDHADEARKMIEVTIPKLIEAEPDRKQRVNRNRIIGISIVLIVAIIIGLVVWKNGQEAKAIAEKNRLATEAYQSGMQYIGDKNYSAALDAFQKATATGVGLAEYQIGCLYLDGLGVSQSFDDAEKWLRKADELGSDLASEKLRELFLSGEITPQSNSEEEAWLLANEKKLDAVQLYRLYELSSGSDALQWLEKSAGKGYVRARNMLGGEWYLIGQSEYEQGNYVVALYYYRKAAELNIGVAQYRVGWMCAYGEGVTSRLTTALYWYGKAMEWGICSPEQLKDQKLKAQVEDGSYDGTDYLYHSPLVNLKDISDSTEDDFWDHVDRYSSGARDINRKCDWVWVNYLCMKDEQTGLTNRERADAAMESDDPIALAAIFDEYKVIRHDAEIYSCPPGDFWAQVDKFSPGSREMNRRGDPVWLEYLDGVDQRTGLTNRQRVEDAMESNHSMAMSLIFDECWRLNGVSVAEKLKAKKLKEDDFWSLVDQYSPGASEMIRNADPVWVEYLNTVDAQTELTNLERAQAAMESNNPRALAKIFDECKRLK